MPRKKDTMSLYTTFRPGGGVPPAVLTRFWGKFQRSSDDRSISLRSDLILKFKIPEKEEKGDRIPPLYRGIKHVGAIKPLVTMQCSKRHIYPMQNSSQRSYGNFVTRDVSSPRSLLCRIFIP